MKSVPKLAFLGMALGVAGCSQESIVCTQSIEPAIVAQIVDSITGAPAAEGARGAVQDGEYVDSLRPFAWNGGVLTHVKAADERPGLYTIEVQRPGYVSWERGAIEPALGVCHVQTVTLVVLLQPMP